MSIYPGEMIWDLTPDDGGPPVQVHVGNPNEAITNHPDRYARERPAAPAPAPEPEGDS